jgi:carboxylesterase type B
VCLVAQFSIVYCEIVASKFGRNVVNTALGKYRGVQFDLRFTSNFTLQDVDSFRGIEYGSIANGLFRFMPSKDIYTSWKAERKMDRYDFSCNQKSFWENWFTLSEPKRMSIYQRYVYKHVIRTSEDCLNLNLYVPTGK